MTHTEQCLGDLRTEVVGMQHYEGRIQPGEELALEREPANPHDRNAIRVMNSRAEQVGHLPRTLAAWLAQLLDAGKVRVEARADPRQPICSTPASFPVLLKVSLRSGGEHPETRRVAAKRPRGPARDGALRL